MSTADRSDMTRVAAIRGAIDVAADTPEDIRRSVRALVEEICARNELPTDRIISAHFTMTPDLSSAFPATSAREAGWTDVPMLCAVEIPVPDSLGRCLRVLVHAYLPSSRKAEHVYLGAAVRLRPDLHAAEGDARP
jgi:chorismate mutase